MAVPRPLDLVMGRIPALDGLRGIAILLVLLLHATLAIEPEARTERFLAFWTSGGWAGVDLFFVLSGFLITGILWDTKGRSGFLRAFYARRALRILPLYYLVLALLIFAIGRGAIAGFEPLYWLHLSDFALAHGWFSDARYNGQWSLAIEEQFYLVWPALVLLLGRRKLLGVCAILIGIALASRIALVFGGAASGAIYVLPWCRMDTLATGAALALLARGPLGLGLYVRAAQIILLSTGAALLLIGITDQGFVYSLPLMQTIGYSLVAGFWGALLVLAVAAKPGAWLSRILTSGPLRAIGKVSYGIYLLQPIVQLAMTGAGFTPYSLGLLGGSHLHGLLVFGLIVGLASYVAAWLSWTLIEVRILSLKRFFVPGTPIGAPGLATYLSGWRAVQLSPEPPRAAFGGKIKSDH